MIMQAYHFIWTKYLCGARNMDLCTAKNMNKKYLHSGIHASRIWDYYGMDKQSTFTTSQLPRAPQLLLDKH
jgi:hypothetical protein